MEKELKNVISVVFGAGGGRAGADGETDVSRAYMLYENAEVLFDDDDKVLIAEQMYDEAIKLDPMFVEAIVACSILKIRRGQFVDAETLLLRALKFRPFDNDTLFNLGTLYLRIMRYDHSLRCLTLALKVDPDDCRSHHNIALTYEALEMFEVANEHWSRVVELDPNDPDAKLIMERLRSVKHLDA